MKVCLIRQLFGLFMCGEIFRLKLLSMVLVFFSMFGLLQIIVWLFCGFIGGRLMFLNSLLLCIRLVWWFWLWNGLWVISGQQISFFFIWLLKYLCFGRILVMKLVQVSLLIQCMLWIRIIFLQCLQVFGFWIMLRKGVMLVLVLSRQRCLLGSRLLCIRVLVGLWLIISLLFFFRCCRCEVSGLFGILMLKNFRCFLQFGLVMLQVCISG